MQGIENSMQFLLFRTDFWQKTAVGCLGFPKPLGEAKKINKVD